MARGKKPGAEPAAQAPAPTPEVAPPDKHGHVSQAIKNFVRREIHLHANGLSEDERKEQNP